MPRGKYNQEDSCVCLNLQLYIILCIDRNKRLNVFGLRTQLIIIDHININYVLVIHCGYLQYCKLFAYLQRREISYYINSNSVFRILYSSDAWDQWQQIVSFDLEFLSLQ